MTARLNSAALRRGRSPLEAQERYHEGSPELLPVSPDSLMAIEDRGQCAVSPKYELLSAGPEAVTCPAGDVTFEAGPPATHELLTIVSNAAYGLMYHDQINMWLSVRKSLNIFLAFSDKRIKFTLTESQALWCYLK